MYKNDESLIKEHLVGEYDLLLNYNQNYGIQEETRTNDFNIVYIDDNSTIKVNTEEGFSDITGGIIIVDTGDFGGLYYLDSLNNRSLFFSVQSREEFSALLTKYDLAQLVVAGTLLTPYLTRLESVTFVLKTLTMFSIVFVVSLVFILYISNYVDVFVNRKRYALKEIMGFSPETICFKRDYGLFSFKNTKEPLYCFGNRNNRISSPDCNKSLLCVFFCNHAAGLSIL